MSSSRDSFVLSVNLLFAGIICYMFFQIIFEMQFSMQFEWISLWMCVSILLDRRFIGTNTTVQANNNNSLHCRRKKNVQRLWNCWMFFSLIQNDLQRICVANKKRARKTNKSNDIYGNRYACSHSYQWLNTRSKSSLLSSTELFSICLAKPALTTACVVQWALCSHSWSP